MEKKLKRFSAIFLALLMVTLCACGEEKKTESNGKKKIVYIQREPSSEEETSSDNAEDNSSQNNTNENDYVFDPSESGSGATETVLGKITAADIGKNYYIFRPEVEHPGVAELDAKYQMIAMDRRNISLDKENMVLSCDNSNVKIDGNTVTIPYSVRSSGKTVTVSMYNREHPNRTGSFTFDFDVQFTEQPTFLDNFDTLDASVWSDEWYDNRMPIEELYCEDGELVMYADHGTKSIELSTTGTFNQAYGSFSARIKMPSSGLSNVAFWLCTEEGVTYLKNPQRPSQSGGEIDIVEYFPTWGDHKTSCTLHWNGWSDYHASEGSEPLVEQTLRGEYHIYSCVWTSTAIYWYIDEDLIWTYTGEGVGPNAGPMQILLQHTNTEEDSDWGGPYNPDDFPNESRVDYVRVYGLEKE